MHKNYPSLLNYYYEIGTFLSTKDEIKRLKTIDLEYWQKQGKL